MTSLRYPIDLIHRMGIASDELPSFCHNSLKTVQVLFQLERSNALLHSKKFHLRDLLRRVEKPLGVK